MGQNIDREEIARRFRHYTPDADRALLHTAVTTTCRSLGFLLADELPEGREKSLAIAALEEVMFWSNAAIARQGA